MRARLIGKIGTYLGAVVLTNVVGLISLPIVIRVAGPTLWGGIAVSTSISSFFSVVILLGWGATGPTGVAPAGFSARGRIFMESLLLRSIIFLVLATPAILLVIYTAPGEKQANVVALMTGLLSGLSSVWFLIGEGRAQAVLLLDTLPRSIGTLVGVFALLHTHDLLWHVTCQLVGAVAATSLTSVTILRRYRVRLRRIPAGAVLALLREQRLGVMTTGFSSLYVNAPLVALAALSPASVPIYALADRLQKLASNVFASFTQSVQAQMNTNGLLEHRIKKYLKLTISLGALTALAYGSGMFVAAPLLSGGSIEPDPYLILALSISLFCICITGVTGLAFLTSLGHLKSVASSTISGGVAGLVMLLLLSSWFGVRGAATAVASSELIVLIWQLVALRKALNVSRLRRTAVQ